MIGIGDHDALMLLVRCSWEILPMSQDHLRWTGRADLHMHTTASDGTADVRTLLAFIADQRPDLDVIAITDHDQIDASLWAYENRQQYPFDVVPGLEVTTRAGHVLALWVTTPIPKGLSLPETIVAIHGAGGVTVIAHPYEPTINFSSFWRYFWHPDVLRNSGADAIELFNAGAITPGCNWLASMRLARSGMSFTGSSDAHMPESVGSGATRFPGKSANDLRIALRTGQTIAEGQPWPITTYWKLLRAELQKRRAFSKTKGRSVSPTHP